MGSGDVYCSFGEKLLHISILVVWTISIYRKLISYIFNTIKTISLLLQNDLFSVLNLHQKNSEFPLKFSKKKKRKAQRNLVLVSMSMIKKCLGSGSGISKLQPGKLRPEARHGGETEIGETQASHGVWTPPSTVGWWTPSTWASPRSPWSPFSSP